MTLMCRGGEDYLIRMETYILMTSEFHITETNLGATACAAIADRPRPRVLIGGLGMAYTLRAALDVLPADARVRVAELNPAVDHWCRTHLAALTDSSVTDPRVTVEITDVARPIKAAAKGDCPPFDAIVLDLYQGTDDANHDPDHPFFGAAALERSRRALTDGGVLGVWTETPDGAFEKRLDSVGFDVVRTRPGKGGPYHAVYLARKVADSSGRRRRR